MRYCLVLVFLLIGCNRQLNLSPSSSGSPLATATPSAPTGTCSGNEDHASLTINCGDALPCSAVSASIIITCLGDTDLSVIQDADHASITTCVQPTKMPLSFVSGSLTVDPSVAR
ncbi:MAG: hypothetical protein ACREL1_00405 [bacterium]